MHMKGGKWGVIRDLEGLTTTSDGWTVFISANRSVKSGVHAIPKGTLRQMLARDEQPILMDGGMGSAIEDHGIDVSSAMWSSHYFVDGQGREINDQIHADYIAAGARILIANTHNTRRAKCEKFLENVDASILPGSVAVVASSGRPEVLHRWLHEQAVGSARKSIPANTEVAVASCLGSIEPLGPYAEESQITGEEACRRFVPELQVRRNSGVDLIIFETLTTRSEIEGVARLARQPDVGDFAVGLTCGPNGKTLAKVSMAEVADILGDAKPLIYFVQCTRCEFVKAALGRLQSNLKASDIVGVYANDNRVWKNRSWQGKRILPGEYAKQASTWRRMGARVIGGCCGIGPKHIAELRSTLL